MWTDGLDSIKDRLRRSFADRANDFALALNTLSLAISGLEGEIEDQLSHVQRLSQSLAPLEAYLSTIASMDEQCNEANIEENDYTTYSYEELAYEFGLVSSSVAKKLSFLENQTVARNMTNLTPIQLEEFESVFRHFDRGLRNSLSEIEFSAAVASLGLVYDEEEMHSIFESTRRIKHSDHHHPAINSASAGTSTAAGGGHVHRPSTVAGNPEVVTFEQFIRFMVDVTEDQNTAEQVFRSFREVADGRAYVTELDLRQSLVPDEVVELLVRSLPVVDGCRRRRRRRRHDHDGRNGGGGACGLMNGRLDSVRNGNGNGESNDGGMTRQERRVITDRHQDDDDDDGRGRGRGRGRGGEDAEANDEDDDDDGDDDAEGGEKGVKYDYVAFMNTFIEGGGRDEDVGYQSSIMKS